MVAIIASDKIKAICQNIYSSNQCLIFDSGQSVEEFLYSIYKSNTMHLIVDYKYVVSRKIFDANRLLKQHEKFTKTIILAPESLSGDLLLSKMVNKVKVNIIWYGKGVKDLKKKLLDCIKNYSSIKNLEKTLAKRKYDFTKKVMFLNANSKAGSSSICLSFAKYLAEKNLKTVYLEFPLDKKAHKSIANYKSYKEYSLSRYPDLIKREVYLRNKKISNLSYIFSNPEKKVNRNLSEYDVLRLLEIANDSDLLLFDVGVFWNHQSILKLLPMIDYIFVLFDYNNLDDAKVLESIDYFRKYKVHSSRMTFIMNKFCHTESEHHLGLEPIIYMNKRSKKDISLIRKSAYFSNLPLEVQFELKNIYYQMLHHIHKELYSSSIKTYKVAEGD